jgi:deoxyribonuclease-4
MSVAGGLCRAIERGVALSCRAIQIFTRNQHRWQAPALDAAEAAEFRRALGRSGLVQVVAHGSYLVNLATADPDLRRRSVETLVDELERASRLGIPYVIVHPGSATGGSELEGLRLVIGSLDEVAERAGRLPARLAIENTAGQGSAVGWSCDHLARIWDGVRGPERLYLCVDTCHLCAAGYDISTARGYRRTFSELARAVPLDRIIAFHANDSRRELGSRVDRHEHIGRGAIGPQGFRRLLGDRRFARVPKLLETPKGGIGDRGNLAALRRLARAGRGLAKP